jgi:hypothetical protein
MKNKVEWNDLEPTTLWIEIQHVGQSASMAIRPFLQPDDSVSVEIILQICDALDEIQKEEEDAKKIKGRKNLEEDENDALSSFPIWNVVRRTIRKRALELQRYELLVQLMRHDYNAYIATAAFLSPSRIPRYQLPNVQDVPWNTETTTPSTSTTTTDANGQTLVPDCTLESMVYKDSLLDKILLSIFRNLVAKNTGGITSEKEGIVGLLEQGRTFMLQPDQTPERQHQMVYDTLAGLMTPALPPFYRIFMSGIVPNIIVGGGTADAQQQQQQQQQQQWGPWFYAPWLTSIVTPPFFGFLVGPSHPNRRKDGRPGGLLVEKCKFLQESGCKGLCLHQCKLPAQQFFQQELGMPLTVQPNFVTQECQWSFGETPKPVEQDPSFPQGCLVGCESRKLVAATSTAGYRNLCN